MERNCGQEVTRPSRWTVVALEGEGGSTVKAVIWSVVPDVVGEEPTTLTLTKTEPPAILTPWESLSCQLPRAVPRVWEAGTASGTLMSTVWPGPVLGTVTEAGPPS